MRLRFLN